MYKFTTPKVELDIYGTPDYAIDAPKKHYEIVTKTVPVTWNLELELRDWGVKSRWITVPDQTIEVDVELYGDDLDAEPEIRTFQVLVKDVTVDELNLGRGVPTSLEFHPRTGWTLVF